MASIWRSFLQTQQLQALKPSSVIADPHAAEEGQVSTTWQSWWFCFLGVLFFFCYLTRNFMLMQVLAKVASLSLAQCSRSYDAHHGTSSVRNHCSFWSVQWLFSHTSSMFFELLKASVIKPYLRNLRNGNWQLESCQTRDTIGHPFRPCPSLFPWSQRCLWVLQPLQPWPAWEAVEIHSYLLGATWARQKVPFHDFVSMAEKLLRQGPLASFKKRWSHEPKIEQSTRVSPKSIYSCYSALKKLLVV